MKYWIIAVVLLSACGVKEEAIATQEPEPAVEEVVEEVKEIDVPSGVLVELVTTNGNITILLYDETPGHRDNFLKLVDQKFYDDLLFHRVINGFMIQGGDPKSKGASSTARLGAGGPGYTIPAEFNPKFVHKKGALAAARTGGPGNPKKASSGSQFYIVQGKVQSEAAITSVENRIKAKNPGFEYTAAQKEIYRTVGGTPFLDMDYTVYGEVVSGMDVVDEIAACATKSDRPLVDVVMQINRMN